MLGVGVGGHIGYTLALHWVQHQRQSISSGFSMTQCILTGNRNVNRAAWFPSMPLKKPYDDADTTAILYTSHSS